jgi:hypothetical protein
VNFLCTPIESNFFLARSTRKNRDEYRVCALSSLASLDRRRAMRTIRFARTTSPHTVTAAVHRFEESIAGRPYLIEVANVSKDRWRAYIVRLPGVPTALMPFYGTTPVEAARQLCDWLTRAHARASASAGSAGSV